MNKKIINKYILSFIICVASGIMFSQTKSTTTQTIEGKKFYIHKIEKGHSLYSIAKLYNVSLDDIYKYNPETKSGTKSGQEIKIPYFNSYTSDTPKPLDTINFIYHKVVTGETKFSICKKYSITEKKLNDQNPELIDGLKDGMMLKIDYTLPMVPAENQNSSNKVNITIDTNKFYCHKVAKGETLYAILRKYNKTEKELAQINPNFSSSIKEGQLIAINPKKPILNTPNQTTLSVSVNSATVASVSEATISKPKKASYTVALILPFKLEQTINLDLNELVKNKLNFPNVPALALDFYLGFKQCIDSLTTKDFEVNIDLYDIDDKDSLKLTQIVNNPKFKQTDFIFGPLYASGFKVVSQRAKELGIPVVSPITQQNKMLYNNIYASKTNPSQYTLLECLADYCIDSLVNNSAKILLMAPYEKDLKEVSYVKAFKKYYNEKQQRLGKPIKDTIVTVRGLAGVKAAYQAGVKNIIVSLSNNQVFITDFTTQLAVYSDKKDILLCGWQSTSVIDNVDQEYLNQLHYTFPYQYNPVNLNNYDLMIENYKSHLNAYPGEYYFIGFDIAYYYLSNLKQNGPDFIFTLNNYPSETNYMRFNFARPDASTGFDNRGVYVFDYNNYHLRKTGWK